MAKVSIFGLGYVGTVCGACLARQGHEVVGVDVNEQKVEIINSGRSPIVEEGLEEVIAEGVSNGRLRASCDGWRAVLETDISLICVGTPSNGNGSLSDKYVRKVSGDIGAALAEKDEYHIVVMRSTVLPGTVEGVLVKELEGASGKKVGEEFGVAMNPEFLREGTSVADFYDPPKTVIGAWKESDAEAIAGLYEGVGGEKILTNVQVAEMVKYVDNVFHALKVTFANEIGDICKAMGMDSHEVMEIFCRDRKLNISDYYLKPGFAFGGSCLPKDVRALTYQAQRLDVQTPVLNSIMPSNRNHIEAGLRRIMACGKKRIGVLGFGFKAGTDDLRESPMVEVVERLLGKGYDIRIYDRNVSLAKLFGANRDYIVEKIPHLSGLMVDSVEEVLQHGEVIVIGNGAKEFEDVVSSRVNGQMIVDLVRIRRERIVGEKYDGLCW